MKYGGALPMQLIRELLDGGFVECADISNIRPGSLDLTLTEETYRVNGAFLPSCDESVRQALKRAGKVVVTPGSILEKGGCYVVRLAEKVRQLPEDVYGWINPKSSSGRVDLHVRLLADKVSRYDSIPRGYVGELWALIIPKTFSVIIPPGLSLNQVRFFNQDTRLDQLRLETSFEQSGGLLCGPDGEMIRFRDVLHSDKDGSIILTLGLNYDRPGFEAVQTGEPIDLSNEKYYDPEFFFRPITVRDQSIILNVNAFYILSTRERPRVPTRFACEMAPMDERSGELRSHYAGFIDPGWGIGKGGEGKGDSLTLEVRSFDNGLIIRDGQPIAKVKYERVIESPEQHYGELSTSNYAGQSGPKLSKHFKDWTQ